MLIFDKFATREDAVEFGQHCGSKFNKRADVFDSQESSDNVDPFPFELSPPIVLVERDDNVEIERQIESSVGQYGGHFAGT